jgi:HSP20 family protein
MQCIEEEDMANRQLTPYRRGSIAPGGFGGASGGLGGGSLFDLHRQMNRLFDDLFDTAPMTSQSAAQGGGNMLSAPALEVHQSDDKLEITAELPGVRQEDIDLHVEDGVLTLSGEKRSERTDQQRGYSERSYGRFERSITLPSNVDEEACQAEFRDGVLTITLPRAAEKQRGRKIPLGSAQQQGGQQPQGGQQAHNDTHEPPRQQAAQQPKGSGTQHGSDQKGPGQQG